MQKIHVVFSPHYDDAVFSMGGFLAAHRDCARVVTVMGGAPNTPKSTPWDRACGFDNSSQAIRLRIEENRKALELLGIPESSVLNWDFIDRQYQHRLTRFFSGTRSLSKSHVIEKMQSLLSTYVDLDIHAYAPLFGIHQDHLLIREAMLSVCAKSRLSNTTFYLYEDLPYADTFLRESGIVGDAARKHSLRRYAHSVVRQDCGLISYRLSNEVMEGKLLALQAYRSQIDSLTSGGRQLADVVKNYALFDDGYMENFHRIGSQPGAVA